MKRYSFLVENKEYQVEILGIENGVAMVSVNGETFNIVLKNQQVMGKAPKTESATVNQVVQAVPAPIAEVNTAAPAPVAPVAPVAPAAPVAGKAKASIKSPLPGIVRSVDVKPGDTVKLDQKVLVLEAMKMDNNIHSDVEGVVLSVNCTVGAAVLEGDDLITIG